MQRKKLKPGGYVRSQRRRREYEVAVRSVEQEIIDFQTSDGIGEPSMISSPMINESGEIFDETSQIKLDKVRKELKDKHGDFARKNAKIIKTILVDPISFPSTPANLSFIERYFPRIERFARTLKRKGRLHPRIEEIFEL